MRRFLLLLFPLPIWAGCNNDSSVAPPLANFKVTIRTVVPTSGRMSDAVVISGSNFDSLQWTPVSFDGVRVAVDSSSEQCIHVRVPRGASTGPLIVYTARDSAVGPVFTVDPPCGADLCNVLYQGPLLTEEQSWQRDCAYRYVGWDGQSRTDSIVLTQGFCVGDDSYFTRTLRFTNDRGPDFLPTVAEAYLVDQEIQGTYTDTLKGIVSIQSWDPYGVVSGKLSWFSESDKLWRDFVFWHDFTPSLSLVGHFSYDAYSMDSLLVVSGNLDITRADSVIAGSCVLFRTDTSSGTNLAYEAGSHQLSGTVSVDGVFEIVLNPETYPAVIIRGTVGPGAIEGHRFLDLGVTPRLIGYYILHRE